MVNTFLNEIKEIHKLGKLVPFIGAGISQPFQIPTWGSLIFNYLKQVDFDEKVRHVGELVQKELEDFNYWEALRLIKRYGIRTDDDIQAYISRTITSALKNYDMLRLLDNNYIDLASLNTNLFLTTNYDDIMERTLDHKCRSYELRSHDESTQELFKSGEKTVFHLHGSYLNHSNIVITEETYNELYKQNKYQDLFKLIAASHTLLFIGFSFDDIFIRDIIGKLKTCFNTKHYIILNNPEEDKVRFLKNEYGIETIAYNIEKSSHVEAIRKLVSYLRQPDNGDTGIDEEVEQVIDFLIEQLPDKEEKLKLEERIFCKKLRIENIKENNIEFSKNCFWLAEQYIRWIGKTKLIKRNEIVNYILKECILKYQELFASIYDLYGDSDRFLIAVHEALGQIDLSRVEKFIASQCLPTDGSSKGMIHFLADTDYKDNEVWWGKERFK